MLLNSRPSGDPAAPFRALLIDSWYHKHCGAILLVVVKDGSLKENDEFVSYKTKQTYTVREVGIMFPNETPVKELQVFFLLIVRNSFFCGTFHFCRTQPSAICGNGPYGWVKVCFLFRRIQVRRSERVRCCQRQSHRCLHRRHAAQQNHSTGRSCDTADVESFEFNGFRW